MAMGTRQRHRYRFLNVPQHGRKSGNCGIPETTPPPRVRLLQPSAISRSYAERNEHVWRSIAVTRVRQSQWVCEIPTFVERFRPLAVLRRPNVTVPPGSLALVKAKRFRAALPRVRYFAPSPGASTEPFPRQAGK